MKELSIFKKRIKSKEDQIQDLLKVRDQLQDNNEKNRINNFLEMAIADKNRQYRINIKNDFGKSFVVSLSYHILENYNNKIQGKINDITRNGLYHKKDAQYLVEHLERVLKGVFEEFSQGDFEALKKNSEIKAVGKYGGYSELELYIYYLCGDVYNGLGIQSLRKIDFLGVNRINESLGFLFDDFFEKKSQGALQKKKPLPPPPKIITKKELDDKKKELQDMVDKNDIYVSYNKQLRRELELVESKIVLIDEMDDEITIKCNFLIKYIKGKLVKYQI